MSLLQRRRPARLAALAVAGVAASLALGGCGSSSTASDPAASGSPSASSSAAGGLGWLDAAKYRTDGLQVVAVPGISLDDARAALGEIRAGDPASSDDAYVGIGLTAVGDGVVLTSRSVVPDDSVAALSKASSGTAAAFSLGSDGTTALLAVKDGDVVRYVDPVSGTAYADGPALPEEKGLDFSSSPGAAGLTFLQRLTGIAVSEDDANRASKALVVQLDQEPDVSGGEG